LATGVTVLRTDKVGLVATFVNDPQLANTRNKFWLCSIRASILLQTLEESVLLAVGARNVADVTIIRTILAFAIIRGNSLPSRRVATLKLRRTTDLLRSG